VSSNFDVTISFTPQVIRSFRIMSKQERGIFVSKLNDLSLAIENSENGHPRIGRLKRLEGSEIPLLEIGWEDYRIILDNRIDDRNVRLLVIEVIKKP